MSKNISQLNVSVSGTVSGLAGTFKAARGNIKGLRGELDGLNQGFGSAQRLIGLGLSAIGVYSFSSLVKSQLEAVDSTGKLADRLGVTTESLVGIEHAGELAGISTESLTGGLEKMLKTIGGGVKELGDDAGDALSAIGLNAKQLKSVSADKELGMIADKLVGILGPADRAAAVTKIFGKSGQQLLPLLMEGSKGIAAATDEAKKLGLTFSHLDFIKVQNANDAMLRVERVATGLGRTLAIQLAPYLEATSIKFEEFATSGEGASGRIVGAFKGVAMGVSRAADEWERLQAIEGVFAAAAAASLWTIVKPLSIIDQGVDSVIEKMTGKVPTNNAGWTKGLADGLDEQASKRLSEALDHYRNFKNGVNSKDTEQFFADLEKKAADSSKSVRGVASDVNGLGAAIKGLNELKPIRVGSAEAQSLRYLNPAHPKAIQPPAAPLEGLASSPAASIVPPNLRDMRRGLASAVRQGAPRGDLKQMRADIASAESTAAAAVPKSIVPPAAALAGTTPKPLATAASVAKPLSPPVAHKPGAYDVMGRGELADAKHAPNGLLAVKSISTGISGILPPDMAQQFSGALGAYNRSKRVMDQPYSDARHSLTDPLKFEDNVHGNDTYGVHAESGITAMLYKDQLDRVTGSLQGDGGYADWKKKQNAAATQPTQPTQFDQWKAAQPAFRPTIPPPVDLPDTKDDKESGKKQVSELTKQTAILAQIAKSQADATQLKVASF